jgi:microcystin-dependent protein
MASPFVAEIRIFAGNFAPTGWATCDGQLLPISQNTALFSLLGTFYGGDGKVTFALPNLDGRVPVHQGQGPGLSQYVLGQADGTETITLSTTEIPAHNHPVVAAANPALLKLPANTASLARSQGDNAYQSVTNQNVVQMGVNVITPTGGDLPHNNLMPYLTLTFCIALQGVFPPRS